MGPVDNPSLWFAPFIIPISIWVAFSDLSTMKIPNKAVLATMLLFGVFGVALYPLEAYLIRWIGFSAVIVSGFLLSYLGLVGAGDAKFAAAMCLYFDLQHIETALFLLAGCTVFCIVAHRALSNTWFRMRTMNWESWERRKDFPMGFPMAMTLTIYVIWDACLTSFVYASDLGLL